MKKKNINLLNAENSTEFAERTWAEGWTRIRTVVDTISEPFLLLDKNLVVIAANRAFYSKFKTKEDEVENQSLSRLGNGQWNIKKLHSSLVEILNNGTFFKGFEVTHHFPVLGHRVMLLNARQIHINSNIWQPLILLAFDDITEMVNLAARLSQQTNKLKFGVPKKEEAKVVVP